jgi:ATP-binding cassette, subfamily B, bacterial MsbA
MNDKRHFPRHDFSLLFATSILAALTGAMQAGTYLLIRPIFNLVLFPAAAVDPSQLSDEARSLGVGDKGVIEEYLLSISNWLAHHVDAEWLQNPRLASLALILGLLVVLAIAGAIIQYGFNQFTNIVSLRMVVDLRVRIAKHLMNLSLRYHGDRKLGDLLSRISSDIQTTLQAVVIWFKDILQNGFNALFFFVVAFINEPILTGVMIVTLPLLAVPVSILAKRVRKRSTVSLTTLGASVQVLSQMFSGIRTVKAFRAERREIERYNNLNERYLADYMRLVRTVSLTQAWAILYSHIGLGILMLFVGIGSIYWGWFGDVGSMSTFFLVNAQAFSSIKRLTRAFTRVEESVGASERLQELLDEKADVVEAADAKAIKHFNLGLRFENVTFNYPDTEEPALININLDIKVGETLAIVGSSGSGKSTLIGLVSRFFDPSSGRILVDGLDLRELTLDSWCDQFSLVDQAPFLFHTTVEENLRYGKLDATQAEIEAASSAAQIHEFIRDLPQGYETNVADTGTRLSGGQRQRITIARALLKGAPLLLLDEATSALDTESERGVQAALEQLMRDRTVIVIAHRLSTIQNADRIAVLENGRLVELGTHAELSIQGGAYTRALEMQMLGQSGE